ncbi:MAG: CDP-alcohol phosphatidyltransferase family protein [Angustibacter sp.]
MHRWLRFSYRCARPIAAVGLSPTAVTLVGLGLALAVLPAAAGGGRWVSLGALAVGASALADSVDGAVAVLTGRASRWGAVVDATADRVADAALAVALWWVGAPGWLAVVAGSCAALHEYVRARAGGVGLGDVGLVTVAERPTRVLVALSVLLTAALYPDAAGRWATAGASASTVLGGIGLVQLLVTVRSRLLTR